MRVGVEGFFCIVRNSAEFSASPHWHFTSEALEEYMKIAVPSRKGWDTVVVGAKLEAFAIAGCDTTSKLCYKLMFPISYADNYI